MATHSGSTLWSLHVQIGAASYSHHIIYYFFLRIINYADLLSSQAYLLLLIKNKAKSSSISAYDDGGVSPYK